MPDCIDGDAPYLAGRASSVRCYHTDRECDRLLAGQNPRAVSEAMVEWHELEECPDCAGEDYRAVGDTTAAIRGGERV